MKAIVLLLVSVSLTCAVTDKQFNDLVKSVQTIKNNYVALAHQVSQQQLYVEESNRASGDSGMKITRLDRYGSRTYFSNTFSGNRIAAIHDHSDFARTVGMGELVAVLNGVEFRTRHNDYKLVMPSRTKKNFGQTEEIPFPEVPPAVLAKKSLDEQIAEMKEWFKAWNNGDYTKRDYRKYFKANLCYMEGMWTEANNGAIDEPFASDRHAIAAKSFHDLTKKVQYTSMTGRKEQAENYAYLPTTISGIDEYGNVKYAQWNYKILCHPLKREVPLTRFAMHDDLANRVAQGKTLEEYEKSRMARFRLYDDVNDVRFPKKQDRFTNIVHGNFLDLLMAEIPGKDNYPANIVDDAYNVTAYKTNVNLYDQTPDTPLNVGYYNRRFKLAGRDAMGTSIQHRGFSDKNLYVAYNTQPKVSPVKLKACKRNYKCSLKDAQNKKCQREICHEDTARVSYAFPLEIIYTTPLNSWNPYNIRTFSKTYQVQREGTNNTYYRNGQPYPKMAYAGYHKIKYYYITPTKFYESPAEGPKDAADTAKYSVAVLDNKGNMQHVSTSGISIHTRSIPGVGSLRLRYPIMPLHHEGSVTHKDVQALKDMTLLKHTYNSLYPSSKSDNGTVEHVYTYELAITYKSPPGAHLHTVDLTEDELSRLFSGEYVTVHSSYDSGHDHELILRSNEGRLYIKKCDGKGGECWDGHRGRLQCPTCRFD